MVNDKHLETEPLRRKEFKIENKNEIIEFLDSMNFGFLSLSTKNKFPIIIPLNFVYFEDAVYFHGSRAGQKAKLLKNNITVTFAVAKEFAIIPSYFTESDIACPATSFFKSILIYGSIEQLSNLDEKVRALDYFMKKLQPEGKFKPFDLKDEEYLKNIKAVHVFKLNISHFSAKYKFGQNQKEEKWNLILNTLNERNKFNDLETVDNMKKYCPFYQ